MGLLQGGQDMLPRGRPSSEPTEGLCTEEKKEADDMKTEKEVGEPHAYSMKNHLPPS